ncbi:MAG: collagenase [Sporomusaceae bacterium]|nr:collagenase [Sporomusaceae bacterium]
MRSITIHGTSMLTVIIGLVFIVLLYLNVPLRPQMWIYPLVRQAAQLKVDYETGYMSVYETEHFRIKYTQADADTIDMIAEAAEAAYAPVTHELNYAPQGKTLILVQPNRNELRQAFGWSGNESAMGVYWGGVIQLLSPHAWLNTGATVQDFIKAGPMVHEYTHLVFDHLTNGNYPRWFTEGLAQYVEYRVNDYEWQTATNKLDGKLYTMAELNSDFDNLPNQSLAYRQSLAAVRYIAEVYGEDKLHQIINDLKAGQSIDKAIQKSLGLDSAAFARSWQQWAVTHMNSSK